MLEPEKEQVKDLRLSHKFSTGDLIEVRVTHKRRYTKEDIEGMLEIGFMNLLAEFRDT